VRSSINLRSACPSGTSAATKTWSWHSWKVARDGMLRRFGPIITDNGVTFRLWAPGAKPVDLLLDRAIAMTRQLGGWYVADISGVATGDRYKFRIDDEMDVP